MRLQQGFATNGMGFRDQVEQQQFWAADMLIGSKRKFHGALLMSGRF
jgi:hypothetical protein